MRKCKIQGQYVQINEKQTVDFKKNENETRKNRFQTLEKRVKF